MASSRLFPQPCATASAAACGVGAGLQYNTNSTSTLCYSITAAAAAGGQILQAIDLRGSYPAVHISLIDSNRVISCWYHINNEHRRWLTVCLRYGQASSPIAGGFSYCSRRGSLGPFWKGRGKSVQRNIGFWYCHGLPLRYCTVFGFFL